MSDTQPRVVVLMATFNGAVHIGDQIRSILDQRDVNVRLIIRDDGSTDATATLAAEMATLHPSRVEIMADSAGPRGSAAANFCTLLLSCSVEPGSWIALADQDDIWFPDKLACAIERMRATDADGYSSNLIAFSDDANAAWQVRKDTAQKEFDYLFQGASAGCTYVLSMRALDVVRAGLIRMGGNGVPPHASHDWLIYALCRSAGLCWTFDSRARIAYRQHSANVYGAKAGLDKMLERIQLLRSRWYRSAILWLRTTLDISPDEQKIFARVERLAPQDRLWLARRAGSFRRDRRDVRQLRLALLAGLFQ